MWVTSCYLGVKKGSVDYLFFLLTQDYIEDNNRIHEALEPLLTKLARDMGDTGAVVRPFRGDEGTTLEQIINIGWTDTDKYSLLNRTPALLVINSSLVDFDPRKSPYVLISLRDSMDEFGNVRVFVMQELFELLLAGAQTRDLFEMIKEHDRREAVAVVRKRVGKALRVEPTVAGIGLDVREALGALRAWLKTV